MSTPIGQPGPWQPLGPFPSTLTNENQDGPFTGYPNAAALAALVGTEYMSGNYGAIAATSDGAINVFNGTSWTAFSTAPTGAAGGDLSGTYPNPTVAKVNGATVPAAGSLTTGHVLKVSGASSLAYGFVLDANVDSSAAIAAGKLNLSTIAQNIANTGTLTNTGLFIVDNSTANAVAARFRTNGSDRVIVGNDANGPYILDGRAVFNVPKGFIRAANNTPVVVIPNSAGTQDRTALSTNTVSLLVGSEWTDIIVGNTSAGFTTLLASAVQLMGDQIIQRMTGGTYTFIWDVSGGNTVRASCVNDKRFLLQIQGMNADNTASVNTVTIRGQQPYSLASGGNRIPSDVIIGPYAATNGGTTEATLRLQSKATDVLLIGWDSTAGKGTLAFSSIDTTTTPPVGTATYVKVSLPGAATAYLHATTVP